MLIIGGLHGTEIIIIALVILLLFGGKKIPELMKGLGKGVKGFKDGMNGIDADAEPTNATPKDEAAQQPPTDNAAK